jgi:DNA-binding response OmpR family regulator
MKILLVEDHVGLAQICCDLLREVYGHDVEHAATGGDALRAAVRFQPDLALIDLNLPDMNGYDVAARLRTNDEFDRMILVLNTGVGCFVDPARAAATGIDAHFIKPLDFSVLPSIKRRRPEEWLAKDAPQASDGTDLKVSGIK